MGAGAALYMAEKNIGDVVLIDVREGLAEGRAADLMQTASLRDIDVRIWGSSSPCEMEGARVVVVTAGRVRTPGMNRVDLLDRNAEIVAVVSDQVRRYAPDSVVIVVTEPVDAMTCLLLKRSGLPASRVMGLTGLLDTVRFRYFIAEELGVSAEDVMALVVGGHHQHMVPLTSYARVGGIPLTELLPPRRIQTVLDNLRNAGARIVERLKEGSSFYTPGACAAEMVETVVMDRKRIISAAVLLDGLYGLKDVCLGVPILLGAAGVEKVFELELEPGDLDLFFESARDVADSQHDILRRYAP